MAKNIKNPIVSGTIALTVAALVTKIFGVIFKVPLSYILMDEGMGYFNSAYTIYGFFFVLSSAGLPKAVTIMVSELDVNSKKDTESLIKLLIRVGVYIGIFLSIIYIFVAPMTSFVLGNAKALPCLLAISPCIICVTVCGIIRGYLNGIMSFFPIALSQMIEAVLKLSVGLLLAYFAMTLGFDLNMIAAFSIMGITCGCIISTVYLLRVLKTKNIDNKIKQKRVWSNKECIKKLIKISFPITLSSALLSLSGVFDLGIIINRLSVSGISQDEAMSLYGNYTTLAIPMLNLITALLMPLSVAYLSKLSSHVCRGEISEFSINMNRSIDFIGFASAPFMMAYALYAYDLLDILFDCSSSAVGYRLLILISPAVMLLPVLTMLNTGLEASGGVYCTIYSLVGGALIKILLTFYLVGIPNVGIMGAPISTVISYFVSIVISSFYLKSRGKVSVLYGKVVFYALLSFISFSIIYVGIYPKLNARYSMIFVPILCFCSLMVYIILSLFIAFGKKTIKKLVNMHKKC